MTGNTAMNEGLRAKTMLKNLSVLLITEESEKPAYCGPGKVKWEPTGILREDTGKSSAAVMPDLSPSYCSWHSTEGNFHVVSDSYSI